MISYQKLGFSDKKTELILLTVKKSCWHYKWSVINLRSCVKQHLRSRSLKTEQSFDKQMCRASCFKQEQQYLRSQFASKFWVTNYKLRVWSWLRTNAGGVPNTCKSNEAFFHRMLAFTERSLVANGWVTRRQPAQKRGITLGNRC